jgi:hypothetical protein
MKKGRLPSPDGAGRAGRKSQAGWAGRTWRRMRPDRNPLRRRSDRVEAFIFGGLLVVAAAGAPVAAVAGGHWAHASAQQAAVIERQTSHQVRAVLLAVPGNSSPSGYSVTATVAAQARWTAPAGTTRTGEIPVPADSFKGEFYSIWTDTAGDLTHAPMTAAQVADEGTFGMVVGALLTLVTLGVLAGFTRLVVNGRRIAGWDADWAVTAPMWTRQR